MFKDIISQNNWIHLFDIAHDIHIITYNDILSLWCCKDTYKNKIDKIYYHFFDEDVGNGIGEDVGAGGDGGGCHGDDRDNDWGRD